MDNMDYTNAGIDVTGMTQEEIDQLIALGIIPAQITQGEADIERAQLLQDTPTPQGRTVRNIYTAANPLEHIGAGMQRYRGQQDEARVRETIDKLRQQQTAGRGAFYDAYANRGGM